MQLLLIGTKKSAKFKQRDTKTGGPYVMRDDMHMAIKTLSEVNTPLLMRQCVREKAFYAEHAKE